MAAHVYWRILITATGSAYVALEEVGFFNAAGTSLATGGTPSASSEFAGPYFASNAFNGNFSDFWHSGTGALPATPEWLQYQFASPVDVASIRITIREGGFLNQEFINQAPTAFTVQYSDNGSAWTTAAGPFNPVWTQLSWSLSFAVAANPGYVNVRLQVNGTQDGTPPDAAELEFRETPGGTDITSSVAQYAIAGAVFSGFPHSNAFDNNAATIWAGAAPIPGNNWIGQSFPRAVSVVQVLWQERNDSEYTEGPTTVTVQGSNDGGITWTDIWIATFTAWTTPGQIQISNAPSTRQPMVTVA